MLKYLFWTTGDVTKNLLESSDLNWESLLKEASSEGILPALYRQVSDLGLAPYVPPEILSILATAERFNAERNQLIIAEAVYIAEILNEIGIQPVALKGLAYLLSGVYPNPAARYLLDIDLLVSADKISRASAHLHKHGYFENDSADFPLLKQHYPALRRTGLPHVEIHHQVGLGVCRRLLPASKIIANSSPLMFNGASFLIPAPCDLVNHLILHSQLHHSYHDRMYPPLRALVDLKQIQHRFGVQIDWSEIGKTYSRCGEFATLVLHVHQAHEILGLPIPPAIPSQLPAVMKLRYKRRRLFADNPWLRYIDPIYLLMSLFSRRLRLVPQLLRNPSSWAAFIRLLTRRTFYRKLFTT